MNPDALSDELRSTEHDPHLDNRRRMKRRSAGAGPSAVAALALGSVFLVFIVAERRRPLRSARESTLSRTGRNLAVALFSAATLSIADRPVVAPVARLVERRRWGLVSHARIPPALRNALALVLLDYTLYLWHVLLHRVPLLWRCHLVHHIDLDLDVSTALRFHFSELVLSVPWRLAQVMLIGVTPGTLSVWQGSLFVSVLFHHSNVRLPIRLERLLNRVIVTPRMHGIHHSIVPEETNSNWSSGLALWDLLHGTARLNVPQHAITIGVPAYQDPEGVTLASMLALPFRPQRRWRQLTGSGEEPQRRLAAAPSGVHLMP